MGARSLSEQEGVGAPLFLDQSDDAGWRHPSDAEMLPMPIVPRAERGGRPPTSRALDKMRQICRGIIASRDAIVGVVLMDLSDSQPVVLGSNPEHLFLDRLLDVARTSAAMFRGASLKAVEHSAEITGRRPEAPVVRSIQVESDTTVTVTRLLDSNHDHMMLLIALKSQPIGVILMTVKQACQELEPLLDEHLSTVRGG